MNLNIEQITLQDFVNYELDDINYKNIIFYFDIFEDEIYNDILTHLNVIGVNHLSRWDDVLKNSLFTIENCDLWSISNLYLELTSETDYRIVLINGELNE